MQFKHFFWLIPVVGYAVWQADSIGNWSASGLQLLHYAPYLLSGIGIFISYYLNRLQPLIIFVSFLVLTAGFEFIFPGNQFGLGSGLFYPLLTLWLPLVLLLWSVMPEKGVHNLSYNILIILLLFLPLAGFYWATQSLPSDLSQFILRPISPQPDFWLRLPLLSTLVALIGLAVLLMRLAFLKQPKVFDSTMIFIYLLLLYGLNQFYSPFILDWMVTISAVLLLMSLIFDAHFIAYNDQLTGLNGRRALLESYPSLGRKYAMAMIDIDHFKKFNDTYGHDVGDLALRQVAQDLRSVQGGGKVYRYGGEEFTLVFPRKTAEEALIFVEQLRHKIEQHVLKFKQNSTSKEVPITVSIGVADRTQATEPSKVLKIADKALYAAKEGGRNQVKVYGKTEPKPKSEGKPVSKKTVRGAKKSASSQNKKTTQAGSKTVRK